MTYGLEVRCSIQLSYGRTGTKSIRRVLDTRAGDPCQGSCDWHAFGYAVDGLNQWALLERRLVNRPKVGRL